MLAKERLMRCLAVAMSNVGGNKERLSHASARVESNTAPQTYAFSSELRKTTSKTEPV